MDITTAPDVHTQVDELVAKTTAAAGGPPELWAADALEKFTAEAVLVSLEQAYKSPFYQEKFAGIARPSCFEEFRRLPFTYPDEIKGRLRDLLACPWEDLRQINMTRGPRRGRRRTWRTRRGPARRRRALRARRAVRVRAG